MDSERIDLIDKVKIMIKESEKGLKKSQKTFDERQKTFEEHIDRLAESHGKTI